VLGNLGVSLAPIALGVVPVSVTARLWPLAGFDASTGTGTIQLQVLAVDASGTLAVGGLNFALSAWTSLGASLPTGYPILVPGFASEAGCDQQVLQFTAAGGWAVLAYRPASSWLFAALEPSSIDPDALSAGTAAPALTGTGVGAGGTLAAWSPLDDLHLVAAVNGPPNLVEVDLTSGSPVVTTLLVAGTAVTAALAAACGPLNTVTALALSGPATSASATQILAVAYTPSTGAPIVALQSLGGGAVSCRTPGPAASALAFGNFEQAFPATPDVLLAASLSNLEQFAVTLTGPAPSPSPQASVSIGTDPLASVPTFGGLIPSSGGVRALVIDSSGDLDTVLPLDMSSLGAVYRLAPYGAVSMVTADVESSTQPVAVAQHTIFTTDEGTSTVDSAGSVLILPLGDDSTPISLGAAAYARGSAWLSVSGVGAALVTSADAAGGQSAAQAAAFTRNACTGLVDLLDSWAPSGPPDLVTVGPAGAGAFGPSGTARYGPSPAPAYFVFGSQISTVTPNAATLECLLNPTMSWSSCPQEALLDLGVAPLDVTFNVGDTAMAVRHLVPSAPSCSTCASGDTLCQRRLCPVASEVILAWPGKITETVPLPSAPLSLAADKGGGYVVSLACTGTAIAGAASSPCFAEGSLCSDPAFQVANPADSGALVWLPDDGGDPACLAVHLGLAGKVALTPNGAEAWVAGPPPGTRHLQLGRVSLARFTSNGVIDTTAPQTFLTREVVGVSGQFAPGFSASGVVFTPDGSIGLVTVPSEYRVALYE